MASYLVEIECLIVDEVQLNQVDAFDYRSSYRAALGLTDAHVRAFNEICMKSLAHCAFTMGDAGTPTWARVFSPLQYCMFPAVSIEQIGQVMAIDLIRPKTNDQVHQEARFASMQMASAEAPAASGSARFRFQLFSR
jgi:hypothetical protein